MNAMVNMSGVQHMTLKGTNIVLHMTEWFGIEMKIVLIEFSIAVSGLNLKQQDIEGDS